MKFNSKMYAESLIELAREATKKEISTIVDQFIKFLVRNRQFNFANQIIEQVQDLIRADEGKVKIVVQSTNSIDKFTRQHILGFLRKKEDQVDFEERIDPNLLGGVRIRLHDTLIDATLAGQLERLRQQLQ